MSPDHFPPDDARRPGEGNVVDPVVLAERRAQRAELAEQAAARRAADAQALAAELSGERARLEAELEDARREPERLSRLVAERERALRAAEQRAHGQEAQRIETAEELAGRVRRHEADLAELAARSERAEQRAAQLAAQRVDELDSLRARLTEAEQIAAQRVEELESLRVRLTEAEQIAAQAESARRRAELKRQSTREKRRRALEARDAAVAELEHARAEAQAAREGADAVIAQASHEQRERDRLRALAEQSGAEREALRTELEHLRAEREAEAAQAQAALAEREAEAARARAALDEQEAEAARMRATLALRETDAAQARAALDAARVERERLTEPPAAHGGWRERFAAELACARQMRPVAVGGGRASAAAVSDATVPAATAAAAAPGDGALALERRLSAARASGLPGTVASGGAMGARSIEPLHEQSPEREQPERAIPATALALERERSTRLQAQLDRQSETERGLREQVAGLQRAVESRMDAEQRIEQALRRVRGELEAANALRMLTERGSSTRSLTDPDPAPAAASEPQDPAVGSAPDVDRAAGSDPAAGTTGGSRPAGEPSPGAAGLAGATPLAAGGASGAAIPAPAEESALAGFDTDRLMAARARLRAAAPAEDLDAEPPSTRPVGDDGAADRVAAPATTPPAAEAPPAEPPLAAHAPVATGATAPGFGAPPLAPPQAVTASEPDPVSPSASADDRHETASAPAPAGPPSPWLPAALRRLLAQDPETAGRIIVGMLPAQGLVAQRDLAYDLTIADRGTVAVDVRDGRAHVRQLPAPRTGEKLDFRVTASHGRLARLLLGRRGLRRRARVRGARRRVKELRRLAREPLALRDLAAAGATLEPALALWVAALAIDPAETFAHRFTIAHAPLPGGPADAWLRIQHGAPPAVLRTRPGEEPVATLRCTRGALLALLAGTALPPGEGAAVDGDRAAFELVRGWIRATEFPKSR